MIVKRAAYRLISLVLCSLILGCGAIRGDPSFPQAIAGMKHSIAPVVCLSRNSDGTVRLDQIDGTAFFISIDGLFLTPAHVIADFRPQHPLANCALPGVYFPEEQWSGGQQVHLQWFAFSPSQCVVDEQLDLAKCRTLAQLNEPPWNKFEPTPVTIDASVKDDGTPIAFTGFPLGIVVPITSAGVIAAYLDSPNGGPPFGRIVIDKAAWPGASGSPIYLEDGEVIGLIVAAGAGFGAGTAYGRSSLTIDAFLKAHP